MIKIILLKNFNNLFLVLLNFIFLNSLIAATSMENLQHVNEEQQLKVAVHLILNGDRVANNINTEMTDLETLGSKIIPILIDIKNDNIILRPSVTFNKKQYMHQEP